MALFIRFLFFLLLCGEVLPPLQLPDDDVRRPLEEGQQQDSSGSDWKLSFFSSSRRMGRFREIRHGRGGVAHRLSPEDRVLRDVLLHGPHLPCPMGWTPRSYDPWHSRCHFAAQQVKSPTLEPPFWTTISIGSDLQAFKVLLDTGSSYLWVPSRKSNRFRSKNKYDSTTSTSYLRIGTYFKISYGSGSVIGVLSNDTVGLGDGRVVSGQVFVEASESQGSFPMSTLDGILGMGFEADIVPPLYNLKKQGLIQEKKFSLTTVEENNEDVLKITWGEANPNHYSGGITYMDVTSDRGYFNVTMGAISVGAEATFCNAEIACFAIVDTGTSLIGGPAKVAEEINKLLKGQKSKHGEYVINCADVNTLPDIVFSFKGRAFKLTAAEHVLRIKKADGTQVCMSAVMGMDLPGAGPNSQQWVIGDVFLRRFFVEFDLERKSVGLAMKKIALP